MSKPPTQGSPPSKIAYAMAGAAVLSGPSDINVSFSAGPPYIGSAVKQGTAMSPSDQAVMHAQFEAKLAEHRGDIRVNTEGLANLKARFEEHASKMASLPTNVATLTERVSHLPTKGFIVVAVSTALAIVAGLSAFVQWVLAARIVAGS